ncbi:MAG: hypothetical protein HWE30_08215 [Methylocystaceae bacterium]|nr:hypothetical protein [Methylocystaceae bacterium]
MYTSLSKSRKLPYSPAHHDPRHQELAQMLVHAFGYEEAVEKAKESHWDQVADTIRFWKSQSLRRF